MDYDNFENEPEGFILDRAIEQVKAKDFMYLVFKSTCGMNEELSVIDFEDYEEDFLYILEPDEYLKMFNRLIEICDRRDINKTIMGKKLRSYLFYQYLYHGKEEHKYNDSIALFVFDRLSKLNVMSVMFT